MNKSLLIKFLRYLHAEADGMISREAIDKTRVDNLNRDIARLQQELEDPDGLSDECLALARSLDLDITERYLPGGRAIFAVITGLYYLSPFGRWKLVRNTEKITSEMITFRDEVDRMLFKVEKNLV